MSTRWTVAELRKALADLPDEAEVRLAIRGGQPEPYALDLTMVTCVPEVNGTALPDLDPELVTDELKERASWVVWLALQRSYDGRTRRLRPAPRSAFDEAWLP